MFSDIYPDKISCSHCLHLPPAWRNSAKGRREASKPCSPGWESSWSCYGCWSCQCSAEISCWSEPHLPSCTQHRAAPSTCTGIQGHSRMFCDCLLKNMQKSSNLSTCGWEAEPQTRFTGWMNYPGSHKTGLGSYEKCRETKKMFLYLGNLNVPWQTCWSSQLCLEREGKGGLECWRPAEGAGQAITASHPRVYRNCK